MSIAHDCDDVFVWTIFADAEAIAKAMGNALDQIAQLGFGQRVVWIGCIVVKDCIVLRERMGRVYS